MCIISHFLDYVLEEDRSKTYILKEFYIRDFKLKEYSLRLSILYRENLKNKLKFYQTSLEA